MEIPTIMKISVNFPSNNWQQMLENTPFSSRPILFHFHQKDPTLILDMVDFVQFLERYLINNRIHFHFPNPIFVLSDIPIQYTGEIPIFNDYNQIPKYFKFTTSKHSAKERGLIRKIELMNSKLRYIPIAGLLGQRNILQKKQKKFIELYKQMEFFKKLAWELDLQTKNLKKK